MRFPREDRLTPREAAIYLELTPWTLASWRMRGVGPPYIRTGSRRIIYLISDLDRWILDRSERAAG